MPQPLDTIISNIQSCTLCAKHLPHGVHPVLQVGKGAKILIAGQAPGRRVHESGVPFDDPSGDRLRAWMGIDRGTFYNPDKIAIVPMGFCYPGTGKSGDLPPRPECAPAWRHSVLAALQDIELTLVIGQYALAWHLPELKKQTVTQSVQNWREYRPGTIVLPHPSPRNNIWLKKNPWFETEVLPALRQRTRGLLK